MSPTPEEEIRDLVGLATFGEGVLSEKDEHRIVKVALARGLGPAATRAAIDGALATAQTRREKPARADPAGDSKKSESDRLLESSGSRDALREGRAPGAPSATSERDDRERERDRDRALVGDDARERAIRKVISRRFDREADAKVEGGKLPEDRADGRADVRADARADARLGSAEARADARVGAAEARADARADARAAAASPEVRAADARAAAEETVIVRRPAATPAPTPAPAAALVPGATPTPASERAADSEVIVAELISSPGQRAADSEVIVAELISGPQTFGAAPVPPAPGRAADSEVIVADVVLASPIPEAPSAAVCAGCLAPVPPLDVTSGRALREPDGRVHCRSCLSRLGAGLVCAKCFLKIERVQLTDGRARAIGERAFHITCLPPPAPATPAHTTPAPATSAPATPVPAPSTPALVRTRTPIEIEPTSPILGASRTSSKLGTKCGGCYVMLTSRDFETGRARRIEGVPYCIACAQRTSKGQG